jgi:acetylornithine deacetylase/succinyl-diaminopimelate desuccinylase-like protein
VAHTTPRITFRDGHNVDPAPVIAAVCEAAGRHGVTLDERQEGAPAHLPEDHPLVAAAVAETCKPAKTAPYGTDASELQAIAPCIVLGPGGVDTAHTPHERIAVADLAAAPPILLRLAARVAALP